MTDPQDPAASADALEAVWTRVRAHWDDDEGHRKYIFLAASVGRLPEAGKRYRDARDNAATPAERAVAEAQLDRLFATAMTVMQAARSAPAEKNHTLHWIAFAIMMFMIAAAAYLLTATSHVSRASTPGQDTSEEPSE